jgi:serine/threonine protein kinase
MSTIVRPPRQAGQVGGYRLLGELTTTGGGQSRWAFARKGPAEFFLKEFLAPTWPADDGPGSAAVKAAKRRRCRAFENHHEKVRRALAPLSGPGGNLVVTVDFFRSGAKYYKVTEKVDAEPAGPLGPTGLELGDTLVPLVAVTHSLRLLHDAGLVHGDLKPGNVLLKRMGRHRFTTKLIDFDDCFFAGRPPAADEVVGDAAWYSPELLGYILGEEPAERIGPASDVFALGLLFANWLAGRSPDLRGAQYPAEAVRAGHKLRAAVRPGSRELDRLVTSMLVAEPEERPEAAEVFEALKKAQVRHGGPRVAGQRPKEPDRRPPIPVAQGGPTTPGPGQRPWLRGTLVERRPEAVSPWRCPACDHPNRPDLTVCAVCHVGPGRPRRSWWRKLLGLGPAKAAGKATGKKGAQ